ncbi:pyridoxal phosphate-dependent aminotransferase [Tenacibaculum sp. M341]|uniref:pyridoxal phosphate-dependent aminotransferase n=1 Tax=Tenacibaculum sp. M341 TaxID=2530339 RepID=UPI0010505D85|nr:aminotransferase class I/II-fold pyridoxal phosphate-dependent enzyme [Tenacibaculum sp. M341]TCI94390.1 aminotransferase class I/II-fold pyridoxal phosphate-dependent enzyme [Tenacibaculum sp. M341]
MIEFANRLQTVEEYYFSKKLKEVRQLINEGKPVINIGIGSPDLLPPNSVIEALKDSLQVTGAHKYQSYQGIPEFREAVAGFYAKNYNVTVNPTSEILPLMGSKEGILHISMAVLNEGDQVLIPNPGYPTYTSVSKLVGATPVFYNLSEVNNYQPDFDALEKEDLSKVKIMWVNYPNMPTGALATEETYKKLIAFGKKHSILIVNDNPYSFILNSNPKSILEIPGAKEVALELNSLSKTFNMAGWRIGMLLGNEKFINNILKVKTQMDSGMFYSLQKGAVEALNISNDWIAAQNKIYEKRRALVWQLAEQLGCSYHKNTSGMFVWAKLPEGEKSVETIDKILNEHYIFIAPGTIFGSLGEGYIRFSLCVSEEKIEEAIKRITKHN